MPTAFTPPQQLDVFEHSRDVMLRNDVLNAIERRAAADARTAWGLLASEYPEDATLPAQEQLIRVLERRDDGPLPDHAALARERDALATVITAAARQALGVVSGEHWLRPLWSALATRCERLPFNPARPDDHAAALYVSGGHWQAVAQAVAAIESWRRIPTPLAWMAEARCRLDGPDGAWALLAELAWLAPTRLDGLLRRLQDPLLGRLHRRFDAEFDSDVQRVDWAWFPAWLLTQTPALAPHLAVAQAGQHSDAERGMRLMIELLGVERQGRHHDIVQRRRSLRDLHAPLYAAYMATR